MSQVAESLVRDSQQEKALLFDAIDLEALAKRETAETKKELASPSAC
jgi:hypothetical protein